MGIKVIWWKPPLPEPAMLSGAVYPQAYCDSVFQSRSAKFSLKPYLQEVGSVYPLACPAGSALSSYIWTIIPSFCDFSHAWLLPFILEMIVS